MKPFYLFALYLTAFLMGACIWALSCQPHLAIVLPPIPPTQIVADSPQQSTKVTSSDRSLENPLSSEEIAERSYQQGQAAYEMKEYGQAIVCFNKAIWFNPRHIDSYRQRCYSYSLTRQLQNALGDANSLLQIDPLHRGGWLEWRSFIYYNLCNYEASARNCNEAIRVGVNTELVYTTRAGSWLGKNDYGKAIADASYAIQLNSNFSLASKIRGLAYNLQGGKSQEAIADLTRAISSDPNDKYSYVGRGCALCASGLFWTAILDGEQALRIDPDDIDAHAMLGTAYEKIGNTTRATFHLQRRVELKQRGASK